MNLYFPLIKSYFFKRSDYKNKEIMAKPTNDKAIWEEILTAEDNYAKRVADADAQAKQLVDDKRKEASQKSKELQEQYRKSLQEKKQESDKKVADLQRSIEQGKKQQKDNAAHEVLLRKDQIVKMLIDAVLNIEIGKPQQK